MQTPQAMAVSTKIIGLLTYYVEHRHRCDTTYCNTVSRRHGDIDDSDRVVIPAIYALWRGWQKQIDLSKIEQS
jgi:hypothetical protein